MVHINPVPILILADQNVVIAAHPGFSIMLEIRIDPQHRKTGAAAVQFRLIALLKRVVVRRVPGFAIRIYSAPLLPVRIKGRRICVPQQIAGAQIYAPVIVPFAARQPDIPFANL
jgi:hypothetical protein